MSALSRRRRFHSWVMLISLLGTLSVWQTRPLVVAQAQETPEADRAGVDAPDRSAVTYDQQSGSSPEVTYKAYIPLISKPVPEEKNWPMAGANPQRTSWVSEEVRGALRPQWFRPIEPYIPANVQIIAANGLLYVATARGLYVLEADTGAQKWVFPTELPLGNSPTIAGGVAYVGGHDKNLYALDAISGQVLWSFVAEGGFDTNPLVVNGLVYAGNRDGYMYAIYADGTPAEGTLAWKYKTDGPIHFSAAYSDNTIYFASNDAYAYALNAQSGALVWKSAKLPTGDGFHNWWPVVQGDKVIFSGSFAYRAFAAPQINWSWEMLTKGDPPLFDAACNVSMSTPLSAFRPDSTMDFSSALKYLEDRPWRRLYYLLNRTTGQELTYDTNGNGKPEFAPLLNTGTNSGTRYPPLIDANGAIYTFNHYTCNYGQVASWQPGSTSLKIRTNKMIAVDEPLGYSAGGNVVYWTHCCDRSAGAFDINTNDEWTYFDYNLANLIPGYNDLYEGQMQASVTAVYGGWNGVYGSHGNQNPPIPYRGKVFMHRSNAIIAFSAQGGAQALSLWGTVAQQDPAPDVDVNVLKQRLTTEVQKMIQAGHLRPGLAALGGFAGNARSQVGDNLADYWSNPADTILVLTLAYPHLSTSMQQSLKTYLQSELANYSPCNYTHTGWATGAARETYILPPEMTNDLANHPATMWSTFDFDGWTGPDWKWPPYTFYAMWKYAQTFGGAATLFNNCKDLLWTPPADSVLAEYPFAHNAWIAGYTGYLELQKLAGQAEDPTKRATLNRLLALRASNFTKNNPWGPDGYNDGQILSVARNFMFMTPELGSYLRTNALAKVQTAFNEYKDVAPYWFVTKFEATYSEGAMQPIFDYSALFAAKALIFQNSREELARYLDVPAFARGDLAYLYNLILTIQATPAP